PTRDSAAFSRGAFSVPGGRRFVAKLLSVAPGIGAQRMGERGRAVGARKDDVVGVLALFRIEPGQVSYAFGNFMIGARSIPADAEATHTRLAFVERDPAAKRD